MEVFTVEIMVYMIADDENEADRKADAMCAQIEQREGVQSTEYGVTKT